MQSGHNPKGSTTAASATLWNFVILLLTVNAVHGATHGSHSLRELLPQLISRTSFLQRLGILGCEM